MDRVNHLQPHDLARAMKEVLLSSFALAGVIWLLSLLACYWGIRLAMQRTPESVRKAIIVGVMAAVVGFVGSRGLTLHFDYSAQEVIDGVAAVNVKPTHWHLETWWFFRFSELGAAVSTFIAVVEWFRLKHDSKALQSVSRI